VVGALGVASTLNAGADETPDAPEQVQAAAEPTSSAEGPATPPAVLPWGERPVRIRKGRGGSSSYTLRVQGLDAAGADASDSLTPRGRYAPKGRSARTSYLKTEITDVAPPEPAPSVSATTTAPTTAATTTPVTTSPTTTSPTVAATTTAPTTAVTTEATMAPTAVVTPPVATTTAAADGKEKVTYLYNVGSQQAETDGFYTNVTISKPKLDKRDYHTLAELAVQSADGQQIVEVGWNVDRVVNGDDDPHLFVYHWVNRVPTCYNGCGFVQYSKTVVPGATLTYDVTKKFGIQYFNGAWWVAFDSEWIGYFPETLWNDQGIKFSRTGLLQVFGEVAATSDKPCTEMGNGQTSDRSTAALMASISYLNGPAVAMSMRTTSDVYPIAPLSARTFRYGGPGAC
jgi:hypothetical protein